MTDFDVDLSGFRGVNKKIEEFEDKWTSEKGYLLGTGVEYAVA